MYDSVRERWISTYVQFKPAINHELVVVDSDVATDPAEYSPHASRFMVYTGGGWDCGIWQMVGREIQTDLLICCNSSTYFHRHGWMERFVEAVEQYGVGLYGSMGSYECSPHLRTPCLVFQPQVVNAYPWITACRNDTWAFEVLRGADNFTQWSGRNGFTPRLVTWDGVWEQPDWRKPDNIFRRGDQSNILVKDRHVDTFAASPPEGKETLSKLADGR